VKVGIALRCSYPVMRDVAVAAEAGGFESVWIAEHLIFPAQLGGSPYEDKAHPPVPPDIPTHDALLWLVPIAQATSRVRLGTYIYNLALRHPFVTARAVQTLDVLSGGRVSLGVGAGWSAGEYAATGVDFASRGRRLDECVEVLRLLFSEREPSFRGEFFSFDPVVFEPKPAQGRVPILVGGESPAALRRAAVRGDGWIGMMHSVDEAADYVRALRGLAREAGRDPAGLEITIGGNPASAEELAAYANSGVHRLIVAPWRRSAQAADAVRGFAETVLAPYDETGR
jgi:probable F420-dependent oxidoreductase